MAEAKRQVKLTGEQQIQALMDRGKERGYLTYDEVEEGLPEDLVSADRLDRILVTLDELGVDVIDESEIAARAKAAGRRRSRRGRVGRRGGRPACRGHQRSDRRRDAETDRRPRADVPDADGRDSAPDARRGNLAGQADRTDAQAVPPQGPRQRPGHLHAPSTSCGRWSPANCRSTGR